MTDNEEYEENKKQTKKKTVENQNKREDYYKMQIIKIRENWKNNRNK